MRTMPHIIRRKVENHVDADVIQGSWAQTLSHLKKKGHSEGSIALVAKKVDVQPVLTAHPTELNGSRY